MKKILVVILLLVAVSIGYLIVIDEEGRWLLFNGNDAEDYALALLDKDLSYQPDDKFIDYVVSVQDGYVTFSEHRNNKVIYGYFPDQDEAKSSQEIKWLRLSGSWFMAKVEKSK